MKDIIAYSIDEILRKARRKRLGKRVLAFLAVLTLISTNMYLRSPAATLETAENENIGIINPEIVLDDMESPAEAHEGFNLSFGEDDEIIDAEDVDLEVGEDGVFDLMDADEDGIGTEDDPFTAEESATEGLMDPVFDMMGNSAVLLSEALESAYPEIHINDVIAASESIVADDQVLSIAVDAEDGDYRITALRDFADDDVVALAFYTSDDGAYLLKLKNGAAAEAFSDAEADGAATEEEMTAAGNEAGIEEGAPEAVSQAEEAHAEDGETPVSEADRQKIEAGETPDFEDGEIPATEGTEEEAPAAEEAEEPTASEEAEEPSETEEAEKDGDAEADDAAQAEVADIASDGEKSISCIIDLSGEKGPFSLLGWIEGAAPVEETATDIETGEEGIDPSAIDSEASDEASAQDGTAPVRLPLADWEMTYDADTLDIEWLGGDYSVLPLGAFEETLITVNTGDAVYAMTLANYTEPRERVDLGLAVVEPVSGEALPGEADGHAYQLNKTEADAAWDTIQAWLAAQTVQPAAKKMAKRRSARNTSLVAEADNNAAVPPRVQAFDIALDHVAVEAYAEGFNVTVNLPQIVYGRNFALYHIHEEVIGQETVKSIEKIQDLRLDSAAAADGIEAVSGFSFRTDKFSTFVLSYTVDFHYRSFTYKMIGGEAMRLSALLDALESHIAVSDAADVTFSNPEVLTVEPTGDGDWLLTSIKAFTTPEILTLTLNDGEIVVIDVTDPPHGYDDTKKQQDITDFLIKAEIYSQNGDTFIGGSEGDPATVRHDQTYQIALTFAEQADSTDMQFTDDGTCTMTFTLPKGFNSVPDINGDPMVIDLGDGDKLSGNIVRLKDGVITVQWNSNDATHFDMLTDSPRTTFTLKFNATINTEQTTIKFNSATHVDIVPDESFKLDVHKTGAYVTDYSELELAGYKKENGKGLVKYTVTVKALEGDGKNIVVKDTLADTSVLKYVQKVEGEEKPTDIQMTCTPDPGTSVKGETFTPAFTKYTDSEKGFSLTIDRLAKDQTATLTYYAEVNYSHIKGGRGTAEQTGNTVTADGPDVHAEDSTDLTDAVIFVDIEKAAGNTEQVTDDSGKTWLLVPWTIRYNTNKEVAVEGETLTDMLYSGAMDAMQYVKSPDQLRGFLATQLEGKTAEKQAAFLNDYMLRVWVDDNKTAYKTGWDSITFDDFEYSDEDARIFTKGASWSWTIPTLADDDERGEGIHSYTLRYYTLVDPSQVVTTDKNGNRVVGNQVGESATGNHAGGSVQIPTDLTPKALDVEKETVSVDKDYIQWKVTFDRQAYDLDRAMLADELPNLPEKGVAKEEIVLNDDSHKVVVTGLYEDEGDVSVEPSKFSNNVIFRFFKNKDKNNPIPGLKKLADPNDAEHSKITVTFWTKNNQSWVTNAVESDWPAEHWNKVTLHANSQQASASAMGIPKVPKIVKEGEQWGTLKKDILDKKDVPLPVLKFTLTVSGVDEDWFDKTTDDLVVGDVYDKHLRLITDAEASTLGITDANKLVLVKPVPEGTSWAKPMSPGSPKAMDDDINNRIDFTVNKSDFQSGVDKDGNPVYDYGLIYKLTYYMVLDENSAISEAESVLTSGKNYTDVNGDDKTTKKGHTVYTNTASLPDELHVGPDKVDVVVDLQPIDKSVNYDAETGKAEYKIEINPMKLTVNNGANYTMKDVYKNLAVDFKSVTIVADPQPEKPIEFAYHGNEGVFQIPDNTHVTISYYAWPVGPKGKTFTMENTASMMGFDDTVKQDVTLSSEFNGSAGVYSVNVYKYADNNMADVKAGAVFQLYGKDAGGNAVPLTYLHEAASDTDADRAYYTENWNDFQNQKYFPYSAASQIPTLMNHKVGDPIYFVTNAKGVAEIRLSMKRDGLGLEMGLQYYLKEVVSPAGLHAELGSDGEPLMWQFMLSDIDDFDHYIYRNKGVLSVSNASEDNGLVLRKQIVGGEKLQYDDKDHPEKSTKNIKFLIVGPDNYRREVLYSEFVKDENGEYRFMLPKDKLKEGTYTVYELKDTADIDPVGYEYEWTGAVEGTTENGGEVTGTGTSSDVDGVADDSPYVKFNVTAEDLANDTVLTAAFTNTYSDKKLALKKVWEGAYPDWTDKSVTFNLYKNGKLDRQVTLTDPNNTVTVPLTKEDSKGNAITWSVAEAVVKYKDSEGVTHTISGADIDEQFAVAVTGGTESQTLSGAWTVDMSQSAPAMTFTNTHHTDGLVKVKVNKTWPEGVAEADKPEITFDLYRTTQAVTSETLNNKDDLQTLIGNENTVRVREGIKLNAGNSWTNEADLKDAQTVDVPYCYFALENSVAGYAPVYTYAQTTTGEEGNEKVTEQTLTIENTKVEGIGTLTVSKQVLGLPAAQKSGKTFAFTVTNNGKYLQQDGSFTDVNPGYTVAEGTPVTFENVLPGEYTVTELNPALTGKTVSVQVKVGDEAAKDGQSAAVTVAKDAITAVQLINAYPKTDYSFDKLWIGPNNRDNTALVWPNGQQISVTVKRRDDTGAVDESFNYTYTIKRDDTANTDGEFDAVTITASCETEGAPEMKVSTAAANVYRFTLEGLDAYSEDKTKTWTYFATEAEVSGYTTGYGRADGIVAVPVTASTETEGEDGEKTTTLTPKTDAAPIGANGTPAAIINRVSTRPVTIPVQKAIRGRETVKAGEFTFALYRNGQEEPVAKQSVDADGKVVFDLDAESVKDMTLKYVNGRLVLRGTLIYRIQEVVPTPKDPTIKYYDMPVTVMDEVLIDWETGVTDHALKVYYPDGTVQDEVKFVKITNTYITKNRDLTLEKTWNDEKNQDGLRRDVTVMVNCVAVETRNGTTTTYEKLVGPFNVDLRGTKKTEETVEGTIRVPMYVESASVTYYQVWEVLDEDTNDNGEQYKFPTGMPDYTYTVAGDGKVTVTVPESGKIGKAALSNTHKVEKINVEVKKNWEGDAEHTDRRQSVKVQLYQNGKPLGAAVELTADGNWTHTWRDLDRYTPDKVGVIARYTVKEVEGSIPIGYKVENTKIVTSADKGGTAANEITNTYDESVSLGVKKVWDDDNDRDGKRKDITGVTMKLKATVQGVQDDIIEEIKAAYTDKSRFNDISLTGVNTQANWGTGSNMWSNLPKYYQGKEITYTVVEDDAATISGSETASLENRGYTSDVSWLDNNGVRTVTNKYTPETVSVQLTKNWNDADNQDGLRPTAKAFEDRVRLVATVNGNTYAIDEDTYYKAHGRITATGDDGKTQGKPAGNYTVTYTNLPKYTNHGQAIVYTVVETDADGKVLAANDAYDDNYTVESAVAAATGDDVSGDRKYTVTNKHDPETVEICVEKYWDISRHNGESDDAYNDRMKDLQQDVSYTLTAKKKSDNQPVSLADVTRKQTATKNTNWKASWDNLPKYAPGDVGKEIVYTVTEDYVPLGFTAATSASEEMKGVAKGSEVFFGETVEGKQNKVYKNTYAEKSITVTKEWEDENDRDDQRPATITVNLVAKVNNKAISFTDDKWGGKWSNYDVAQKTLSASENWTATWTGLPAYADNASITYSVEEVQTGLAEKDYRLVTPITGDMEKGYTLTNKRDIALTDLQVTKTWEDENNRDNKRPTPEDYVTKYLHAYMQDGSSAAAVELEPQTESKKTENGVLKMKLFVEGEQVKHNGLDAEVWVTGSNQKVGNSVRGDYVVTYKNLPYFSVETGMDKKVTYTVEEKNVTGTDDILLGQDMYTAYLKVDGEWVAQKNGDAPKPEVSVAVAEQTTTSGNKLYTGEIKNVHTHDVTTVTVTKKWVEPAANADQKMALARPESVTVQLYAKKNGGAEEAIGDPVRLTGDGWTHTWDNLDINEADLIGQAIEYQVREVESGAPVGYVETDQAYKELVLRGNETTVTNTYTTGALVVRKTVDSALNADKEKEFTFTVKLENLAAVMGTAAADNSDSANETGNTDETDETDNTDNTGDTGDTPATGGDNAGANAAASRRAFTPGNITIAKSPVNDSTLRFNDNGVVTFTLAHGEYVTISNLPIGLTYSVEEEAADHFTTAITEKTGTADTDNARKVTGTITTTQSKAVYTNTRESGYLNLKKMVESPFNSEKNGDYEFTVLMKKVDGVSAAGTYPIGSMNGTTFVQSTGQTNTVSFAVPQTGTLPAGLPNGWNADDGVVMAKVTVSAANANGLVISGLPDGVDFLVIEEGQTLFNKTYTTTTALKTAYATDTIAKSASKAVTITNTRKVQPISLKKVSTADSVGTGLKEGSGLSGAKFELTQRGKAWKVVLKSGTDGGFTVESTTGDLPDDMAAAVNATQLTLPLGDYLLTETKAPDGYNMLEYPVEITVTKNDVTYKAYFGGKDEAHIWSHSNNGNGKTIQDVDDTHNTKDINLLIPNSPGVKLPSTGGEGTLPYTVLGSALALLAIALLLRKGREY